jgi:hypothetical protein
LIFLVSRARVRVRLKLIAAAAAMVLWAILAPQTPEAARGNIYELYRREAEALAARGG